MPRTLSASPGRSANFVTNPGFEVDASDWTLVTAFATFTRSTTRAKTGQASGRLAYAAPGFAYGVAPGGDLGDIRLGMRAGRTYTFSVWVYVPSTSLGLLSNIFVLLYDHTVADGYAEVHVSPTVHDEWQQLVVTRTLRADADEAFVRVVSNDTSVPSFEMFIDEATLYEGVVSLDVVENAVVGRSGLFPPFYPGSTAYPGIIWGYGVLNAAPLAPLDGLFPPFYPGSTAYPGRGTSLGATPIT